MKISPRETLSLAFQAVWNHKFRSGLTVLGVVIGITTVVTVASLMTGLRKSIVQFFEEFGPNSIFIARVSGDPSGANAPLKERRRRPLKPETAAYLKSVVRTIDDVSITLFINAAPGTFITAKVPGFESDNVSLIGVTANGSEIIPRDLRQGRTFTQGEGERAQRVVAIGSSLADALFPAGDGVGKQITVDGTEYTVLGVFAPAKGGFFGENGLDRQIVAPFETIHLRYPQADGYFFTAKAKNGQRADAIEEIRNAMRKFRRIPQGGEDDFSISTADSIIENFDRITGMIIVISIAISAIGLLVGGIGVMNIMLVSVTERTREIGVRKAIGARRSDIILQFLSEAVALTGAGGLIGIIFSVFIVVLLNIVLPALPSEVPLWAVMTGLGVSVAVGVFFGVWPAVQASRLDPVEALRYE
ncbi:MAG TPA: ABC transporter permease [Terriglobales bacterium]|nr:ABC transporter permease [Terriglobales bacterium]